MSGFIWPSKDQIIAVHDASLKRFGGAEGIRDQGLLESALARPFASFAGREVFPSDIAKVCAMCHALVTNHPFVDGNKRVGAAILGMVLRVNGLRFKPRHEEFYAVILGVASGKISLESLTSWVLTQIN